MKPLVALGLLLAGAATALATVAEHQRWWGLLLGLAATVATIAWLRAGWWCRLAFCLGWTAMVGYLTVPRPEGDYALGQDAPGYAVLAAALVVLVAGLATLPPPRRGSRSASAAAP